MLSNSRLSVTVSLLLALKLLLTFSSAHSKLLKSECKLHYQVLSQLSSVPPSTKLRLMKVSMGFTRVLPHFGLDKSHTLSSNSYSSKRPSKLSTDTYLLNQRNPTAKVLNFQLPSCLVTLLVFFALLSPTQLILWFLRLTTWNKPHQLVMLLKRSILKLDLEDYGAVLAQELLWLVPSPVSNGGFTIDSRLWLVLEQLVVSKRIESDDIAGNYYVIVLTFLYMSDHTKT